MIVDRRTFYFGILIAGSQMLCFPKLTRCRMDVDGTRLICCAQETRELEKGNVTGSADQVGVAISSFSNRTKELLLVGKARPTQIRNSLGDN